jgi:hypothetical protein
MTYVYLASPYSHPDPTVRAARYLEIEKYAVQLQKLGNQIYSPIMHWHNAAIRHDMPTDASFWQKSNFAMLRSCAWMIVMQMEGWKDSNGIKAEIEYAEKIGKRIVFLEPGTWSE